MDEVLRTDGDLACFGVLVGDDSAALIGRVPRQSNV